MNDDAPRYASFADYVHLLRKHWLLIVLPIVIGAVGAWYFSHRQSNSYQATAAVSISDEASQLALLGTSVDPTAVPGTSPEIVAETGNTAAVAAAVQRDLNTRVPVGALQGMVSMSVDTNSSLVDVTAKAGSPMFAADVANAFAKEIANTTTANAQQQFKSAQATVQARLKSLGKITITNSGEVSTLQNDINQLAFLRANSKPGQVEAVAGVPSSPVSPKPLRNAGLGALAGLVIGLILAFLRDSFDRRMRGSAEIHNELGFRLLGQVRSQTMGRSVQPSTVTDKSKAGDVETFRIMRRNVEFLISESRGNTILITSALPEEGKSTVAASLALAVAVTGRRTLLIEADLRRPSLSTKLGIEPTPGLTEYLLGNAQPADILQTIAVPAPNVSLNGDANSGDDGDEPQLVCIASGTPTGRSAELLASNALRSLLSEVSQVYDLVLIDSAPLLPVADTLELLPHVANVALCVRSRRTTRDQARAAKAALSQFRAEAIGIVVTGLQPRDEPAGYGLYPYDYSYAGRTQP